MRMRKSRKKKDRLFRGCAHANKRNILASHARGESALRKANNLPGNADFSYVLLSFMHRNGNHAADANQFYTENYALLKKLKH